MLRVLLNYYRRVKQKGYALPPDAERMLKDASGRAARKRAPDQLDHLVGQCDRFASVSFLTLPPSR